ncbi:DUF1877 domain-containing protein [Microbacterium paludicola]|uniref:DUF1877 domain-containing protein n=1 Tax=Microbacterium paludicola TaxID=300019 RepID=UPI00119E4B21|nr:DUF1877 domain-containing protein [Microbacterium paludicola]
MGIRYYAYAFDADLAQQAVHDPRSIVSSDPLADAWGMEPHASVGIATFEQVSPKGDMLYLDKAWSALQSLTHPRSGVACSGACHRMFAGRVTMHERGWSSWVRTILPEEVPAIRDDLIAITDEQVGAWMPAWLDPGGVRGEGELRYVLDFLHRAQAFVETLTANGRGMVYLIG